MKGTVNELFLQIILDFQIIIQCEITEARTHKNFSSKTYLP